MKILNSLFAWTGCYNSNYNGGTNIYKKPGRLDYTWVLLGTTINTGTNKLYKKRQQLRYTLVLLTTTIKTETNSNYSQRQLIGTTKNPNHQELHVRATTSHYKKRKHPTTTKNFKYYYIQMTGLWADRFTKLSRLKVFTLHSDAFSHVFFQSNWS